MTFKNRLNKNYWLRKIYTSKFYQFLPINKKKLKKKIFTSIYKSNHWVQNGNKLSDEHVSVSGHGSNINTDQFYMLKDNFIKIIKDYKISSILDMPCGDFLWIKRIIENKDIDYLGVDIVEELIINNKKKYQSKNINFQTCDIIDFKTNKYFDLIIIRDLFIHIKNNDIIKILDNLKLMNVKYIALNTYSDIINNDVVVGQHRKVNLLKEPFNLDKPIHFFQDYEHDKYFYLYDLNTFR